MSYILYTVSNSSSLSLIYQLDVQINNGADMRVRAKSDSAFDILWTCVRPHSSSFILFGIGSTALSPVRVKASGSGRGSGGMLQCF